MAGDKSTPKYTQPGDVDITSRRWPGNVITHSPIWCSVDLRDGNQALPNPLCVEDKLEYFKLLCDIGFKHIETAFPSASKEDFDFTRRLITDDHIPNDVFVMSLTQCRSHLIDRTFEAIEGVKQGIVHIYLATSDLHVQQVFSQDRRGCLEMAVDAAKQVRDLAMTMPNSDIRLEFSPEEFTDTDIYFALDICHAIYETWGMATEEKPLILNLPATVERRPPNQYADMIELFSSKFAHSSSAIISLHAHNDQGMAVAATELGLLAGGQRVEGTLFGHGERTGNVDLITLAMNLQARGVKTGLDLSKLPEIAATVERLTGMGVYYRQPYSGEYAFTAFSGSHQDAIAKGVRKLNQAPEKFHQQWKVPYLHIDPTDVGKKFEALIRINTQSGKGGIAWVLEREYDLDVPKAMHAQLGQRVQEFSDEMGKEITSAEIYAIFKRSFVNPPGPYELLGYWPRPDDDDPTIIHGQLRLNINGKEVNTNASGNGPLSAFVNCLRDAIAENFEVKNYTEQAIGQGADAQAVAYVPLSLPDGTVMFGVGIDTNIDQAAVHAIIAGINRIATR